MWKAGLLCYSATDISSTYRYSKYTGKCSGRIPSQTGLSVFLRYICLPHA